MDGMTEEEEWLASILKNTTRMHHEKSLKYFTEYMKKNPKEILELRRKEGRRFSTRVILFWKWLQENKGLSENTSSSYVIGVQSFFSYFDLPLKLKGKIPDTRMKLERYQPTLEDFQKIYRLGDLQTKAVLSLMRDCPARVGDLVKKVIPRIKEKEFLIESEKETVVGKVYISEETLTLFKQLKEADLSLPRTKRGIGKLLEKASRIANIPKFNPQLMRKYFFTIATNLNLNRDIVRVLTFKSVSKDILTYWLNREDLRDFWKKVINAIPLESRPNGRISSVEEMVALLSRVLIKLIEEERGRPFGTVLGILAKGELNEREYLEQYLKESYKEEK